MKGSVAVVVVGATFTLGATSLWADVKVCTAITTVPTTISAPGVYCLGTNLETTVHSGTAITIASSNVTLDFNGFFLSNTNPKSSAIGVAWHNRDNVVLRNGTIAGFDFGIAASTNNWTGVGNVIEQMRIVENRWIGIIWHALPDPSVSHLVIRDCLVYHTGVSAPNGGSGPTAGVYAWGGRVVIINNEVRDVRASSPGVPTSYGIRLLSPTFHVVVNNRISKASIGISLNSSAGEFRDNITTSVPTPYVGGQNLVNNSDRPTKTP